MLGIVLPAAAGATGAYQTQREYGRSAKRSQEMVSHIEELKGQMISANDFEGFAALASEAEETMLHENQDWRVLVLFRPIELR
jgi:hypothetical protein